MGTFLGKLTYANVMATIAVFVALGGVGYAATGLAPKSVGTAQLKGTAVTTPKIAREAVTGAKIKISSLGTVPSAASANNAQTLGGLTSAQITNQAAAAGAADGAAQATSASKVRCAAGTTPSSGVCFSPLHTPTDWYHAIEVCGAEGMTLPTAAQVYVYGKANNKTPVGFEWTGDALSTTTALEIQASVGGNGAGEGNVFNTIDPYHCVGNPTN